MLAASFHINLKSVLKSKLYTAVDFIADLLTKYESPGNFSIDPCMMQMPLALKMQPLALHHLPLIYTPHLEANLTGVKIFPQCLA